MLVCVFVCVVCLVDEQLRGGGHSASNNRLSVRLIVANRPFMCIVCGPIRDSHFQPTRPTRFLLFNQSVFVFDQFCFPKLWMLISISTFEFNLHSFCYVQINNSDQQCPNRTENAVDRCDTLIGHQECTMRLCRRLGIAPAWIQRKILDTTE